MKIAIFTDGSCEPNPGIGGWSYVIIYENQETKTAYGGDPDTTNNRMELTGLLEALKFLNPVNHEIFVFSDSNYLVKGVNEWCEKWIALNKKKMNMDLWKAIIKYKSYNVIICKWIQAHSGIKMNELADELAQKGRLLYVKDDKNIPDVFLELIK